MLANLTLVAALIRVAASAIAIVLGSVVSVYSVRYGLPKMAALVFSLKGCNIGLVTGEVCKIYECVCMCVRAWI